MMFGKYGRGGQSLPRVLHISISRFRADLPRPGEPLDFLVSIHEEGTGLTWQQNVTLDAASERFLLDATQALYGWSRTRGRPPAQVREHVATLGTRLYDTYITSEGAKALASIEPTAILLDVDETMLNLPWELIADARGPIAQEVPFGRLVTSRLLPKRGRDPMQEDATVRILVVANPTGDLPAAELEADAIARLGGRHAGVRIDVDDLTGRKATREAFRTRLGQGDYDILHFAGHSYLEADQPDTSALRFADGVLQAAVRPTGWPRRFWPPAPTPTPVTSGR
jgi:hypothetical protein